MTAPRTCNECGTPHERPDWYCSAECRRLGEARTSTIDTVRDRIGSRALVLSGPTAEPHWACGGCGQPCYCVDPASRAMPHVECAGVEVAA